MGEKESLMTDKEFEELLKGVQAGKAKRDEKIERKSGEDLEEILDKASKKGKWLTYEEVDEVIREIKAEEKGKKEADGMAESRDPEFVEGKSPSVDNVAGGNKSEAEVEVETEEQEEAPMGHKRVKRKLVLKDDPRKQGARKEGKRASGRILGRGDLKKKGPGKAADPVEISSEEDKSSQKKKSRAMPTGQEEEESTKPVEEPPADASKPVAQVET